MTTAYSVVELLFGAFFFAVSTTCMPNKQNIETMYYYYNMPRCCVFVTVFGIPIQYIHGVYNVYTTFIVEKRLKRPNRVPI